MFFNQYSSQKNKDYSIPCEKADQVNNLEGGPNGGKDPRDKNNAIWKLATATAAEKNVNKIDKAAKWVAEAAGKVSKGAGEFFKLSKNDIKHLSNKHIFSDVAKQAKRMPRKALEAKLEKTFFNPKWSKEEIIKHVTEGYNDALRKGLTRKIDYKVNGEIIKIFIKGDGKFDTAYGLHKLPIDHFI